MKLTSFSRTPFPLRAQELGPALYVGAMCGMLTALIARGALSGVLIVYAPLLLLFALGWVRGVRAVGIAVAVALLLCFLSVPEAATSFLITEAMPALFFLRLSLTYLAVGSEKRDDPEAPLALHITPAFSIGWVLSAMAVYGAAMLSVLALLPLLSGEMPESGFSADALRQLDPLLSPYIPDAQARENAVGLLRDYLFLFLGLIGWFWVLGLYATAALARYFAEGVHPVAPRRLVLQPFAVPTAVLAMMVALGAAALLLPEVARSALLLKTAFVLLMFPYFLSGVAQALSRVPEGQKRAPWVLLLVVGLTFFPFAAAIFIAMGLLHPLKSPSLPAA